MPSTRQPESCCGRSRWMTIRRPPSPQHRRCMRAGYTCRFRRAKKPRWPIRDIRAARFAAACSRSMPRPASASGRPIRSTSKPVTGQKNSAGIVIVGPSGAPVWNTPTIDVERNILYVGTGNNYSPPATALSDSVLAIDMSSGKISWHRQQTENDIWNGTCRRADREAAACPDADAPDVDFSVSPVLVKAANGTITADRGKQVRNDLGTGPGSTGKYRSGSSRSAKAAAVVACCGDSRWMASRIYVPNGFFDAKSPDASGGMAALDLRERPPVWSTPNPPCVDRNPASQVMPRP